MIADLVEQQFGHVDNLRVMPANMTLLHILMNRLIKDSYAPAGSPALVQVLMDKGANPNLRDQNTYSAFDRVSCLPASMQEQVRRILSRNGHTSVESRWAFLGKRPTSVLPSIESLKARFADYYAQTRVKLGQWLPTASLAPLAARIPTTTALLTNLSNRTAAEARRPDNMDNLSLAQDLNRRLANMNTRMEQLAIARQERAQAQAAELDTISEEKQLLTGDLQAVRRTVTAQQAQLKTVEARETRQAKELQSTQTKLQKEIAARKEKATANDKLNTENHRLAKELQTALLTADAQKQQLEARLAKTRDEHQVLMAVLKARLGDTEDSLHGVQAAADVSRVQAEEAMKTARADAQKQKAQQQKQYHALEKRNRELASTLKAAQENQAQTERSLGEKDALAQALTRQNEALQQTLEEAHAQQAQALAKLTGQLEAMTQDNSRLRADLSSTRLKMTQHVMDHAQFQQVRLDKETLRKAQQSARVELDALQATIPDLKHQHAEAIARAERAEAHTTALEEELAQAWQQATQDQMDAQQWQAHLQEAEAYSASVQEHNMVLQATLQAWQAQGIDPNLMAELTRLQHENAMLYQSGTVAAQPGWPQMWSPVAYGELPAAFGQVVEPGYYYEGELPDEALPPDGMMPPDGPAPSVTGKLVGELMAEISRLRKQAKPSESKPPSQEEPASTSEPLVPAKLRRVRSFDSVWPQQSTSSALHNPLGEDR